MLPQHNNEFLRCLTTLDVAGIRRLWQHVSPNLPQPKNEEETLTTMHIARTASKAVPAKARLFSHDWLIERGFPSQLPDELLPPARRQEKRVVQAVGISVNSRSPDLQPVAKAIEKAMSDAVADAFDSGRTDDEFVRARMDEARARTRKKLLGSVSAIR